MCCQLKMLINEWLWFHLKTTTKSSTLENKCTWKYISIRHWAHWYGAHSLISTVSISCYRTVFLLTRQKPHSKAALKLRQLIHIYVSICVNPKGVSRKDYKCETDILFYHLFSQSAARSDSPAVCQNLGNSLTRQHFQIVKSAFKLWNDPETS